MKKVLIVVDYQVDFVSGSLGFPGAELLEDAICERIEQTLRDGGKLIFTYDTHPDDYLSTKEGRDLPVLHCIRGSEGWQLYGRVNDYLPRADALYEKETFGSLALAEYLRQHGFDEVELCGLVSNICVLSNAVLAKAALPEAVVTVDARCTGCADQAANEKALDILEGLFIQVLNRA